MSATRKVFVNSFEVHHDPGGVRSVMDYKLKHYRDEYVGAAIVIKFRINEVPYPLTCRIGTSSTMEIDKKIAFADACLNNTPEIIITPTDRISKLNPFFSEIKKNIG